MSLSIHAHTRPTQYSLAGAVADVLTHIGRRFDCQICICEVVHTDKHERQLVLAVNITQMQISLNNALRIVMNQNFHTREEGEVQVLSDATGQKFKIALFYTPRTSAGDVTIDSVRASLVQQFQRLAP